MVQRPAGHKNEKLIINNMFIISCPAEDWLELKNDLLLRLENLKV
jgi:hypothetical protein